MSVFVVMSGFFVLEAEGRESRPVNHFQLPSQLFAFWANWSFRNVCVCELG